MIRKLDYPGRVHNEITREAPNALARAAWKIVYYERGLVPLLLTAGKSPCLMLSNLEVRCVIYRDDSEAYTLEKEYQRFIFDVTDAEIALKAGDTFTVMAKTYNLAGMPMKHDQWPLEATVVDLWEESGRKFLEVSLDTEDEA